MGKDDIMIDYDYLESFLLGELCGAYDSACSDLMCNSVTLDFAFKILKDRYDMVNDVLYVFNCVVSFDLDKYAFISKSCTERYIDYYNRLIVIGKKGVE